MTSEQRLRDELSRAAEIPTTDTPAALARVVATNRRRQRTRHIALALVAVVVAGLGLAGLSRLSVDDLGRAPGPADRTTHVRQSPADVLAGTRTVLTGEWQSPAVPVPEIEAALAARHVTDGAAHRLLGTAQQWRVQLTFSSTRGTAALVVQTSDPQNPGASLKTSDLLRYHVRPDRFGPTGQLVVSPTHPGPRMVFAYHIGGDQLTLRFRASASGSQHAAERARSIAWSSVPLSRVH